MKRPQLEEDIGEFRVNVEKAKEEINALSRTPNALRETFQKPDPVPMILICPVCYGRHIDEGEFATKPHHTHACQHCGMVWRPALVPTVGVQFLPGFKNEAPGPKCQSVITNPNGPGWMVCSLPEHHDGPHLHDEKVKT